MTLLKKAILCVLLLYPLWLCAQDYQVSLIPDSLKENADVVKRFEELRIVIKGPGKAVVQHKYALTILNEAGDHYAVYVNYYDKMVSLSDISGRLYDANGKVLKFVKKKDILDASAEDDVSLVTDTRYKKHSFFHRQYPYTVEYEDEQVQDGIFFLPAWYPGEDEDYAVQQSKLIVETDPAYTLRYKLFNVGAPIVTDNGKFRTYTWEARNMKVVASEPFQPDWKDIAASVQVAPADFEIGGYKGNMSTWQNLGKFILALNDGRDVLPEQIKKEVHTLTDGVSDKREKIKVLYEYLQKNTRYISINLGIGGWQPFDATYVATKRYGDCKALSNYMRSLLKEAGIASNYVLVKSGEGRRGLWEDFPGPYFNHAILCVPDARDSIWLECTSETGSAGFMGSHTGDRQALLIAEDGGHVVWTPRYSAAENVQRRRVDASIDADGNLVADVHTVFTGIQQELQHSLIHDASKEEREKYLNRALGLPTYKVDKIEYTEQKQAIPVVVENLHIQSVSYASVSGRRLFITPNLFNRTRTKLQVDKPRKYDIKYSYSYIDIDSVFISIPQGYMPEALPKPISVNNKFGNYSISFAIESDKIKVIRVCERVAGRFPPGDYAELAKFYADMYKADNSAMVFVKN